MNVSSGRTLLRRELPTLGNLFADSGWSTGLFGKWHLGDTYPYRPQDRGFHESVWFPSSHIGSVPDQWQNDYFDDTYIHNGRRQPYTGYTTDVLFREAMTWMKGEADAERPFLCYLATAAAHQPHFVPEKYLHRSVRLWMRYATTFRRWNRRWRNNSFAFSPCALTSTRTWASWTNF